MWTRCVLFVLISVISARQDVDSKSLSAAITRFSIKFCNELDKTKNVVSSPLSVELMLGLLTLGTTDPAHAELLTSLGITDDDAIRTSFAAVSSQLTGLKGVKLNIANKLYLKEGSYDIHPHIKEDAVQIFKSDVEKVDFNDNAAAVDNINSWVDNNTHHKIKNLLTTDNVDSDTSVVLINALSFKGAWKSKFNTSNTMDQMFFLNVSTTVQIPMMEKKDDYSFGFSDKLQAQLLELPYVGDEASLLLVVPDDVEGLNDVMTKLAGGHDLMTDMENMFKSNVQVTIPKFKIETEIDLKELLPKLGVNAIFNSDPGLTKIINSDEPLYVSRAVQKAFIEVNEQGAKAAAATGISLILRRTAPEFRADRPFLYLLLGTDRTPLFIGIFRGIA